MYFSASAEDFNQIPGSPIAYWLSDAEFKLFKDAKKIGDKVKPRQGMSTNDNQRFLRRWFEVPIDRVGIGMNSLDEATASGKKWFAYNKGGEYRKWQGNNEYLVNWKDDGSEIKHWLVNNPQDPKTTHWSRRIINTEYYFKEGLTWSFVSSSNFGIRYTPNGFLFDVGGSSMFPVKEDLFPMLGYLCSKIAFNFIKAINPTLNFQTGNLAALPWPERRIQPYSASLDQNVERLIFFAKSDWNAYETSWDFTRLPLLQTDYLQPTLKATYQNLRAHWRDMTLEMQRLEEENNRIFIEAYGLQDELTPEVPLEEITLTCNPYYRFGVKALISSGIRDQGLGIREFPVDEELEAKLLSEAMKELVSYAAGCMFGRYSLDIPGLVLANQGETVEDYRNKLADYRNKLTPNPSSLTPESVEISFPPDEDNVIPVFYAEWFNDDITERFQRFLRVAFGEEHYEENLQFVEKALGKNGKARDIRDYFLKDFYSDHVKRYKKRPIYWLFSSPKGSFNALIYMHRYRPDTVSVVLNDYLREFRTKLTSHKNHLEAVSISAAASQAERTKAIKEIEKLKKIIDELDAWEHDVLYPLATQRIEIDLDDGVKVNYPKFGEALKKVPGLST